jgi:hypothetical protein
LTTGKSKTAYFDFVDKQKIKEIFTSEMEDELFCVYDKSVKEINLNTLKTSEVYKTEDGEVVEAAYYCTNEEIIKIVTSYVMLFDSDIPVRRPRMHGIEMGDDGFYRRVYWYELPFVDNSILWHMSVFYREIFTQLQVTSDKNKLNHSFFISAGVFINYDPEANEDIASTLCVDKHLIDNKNKEKVISSTLNPFSINYVIGEFPAAFVQMSDNTKGRYQDVSVPYQLLDISDDRQTIVAITNDGFISYKFYDGCFNEACRFSSTYEDVFGDSSVSGARIGKDGHIYYWVGANKLFRLDTKKGINKAYEGFIPGLSIMGCDFRNADMSTVTRFTLRLHGGLLD